MQIVSQSASLLHSLFPPVPLLAAPPIRQMIAPPTIAGLLPERVTLHGEVILDKPLTRADLLQQLGPIRSREEMNAEIVDMLADRFGLRPLNGWSL